MSTLELLHRLHLRTSKLVKECAVSYLSFNTPRTRNEQRGEELFVIIPAQVLWWSSMLLYTSKIDVEFPQTCLQFSKWLRQRDGEEYVKWLATLDAGGKDH